MTEAFDSSYQLAPQPLSGTSELTVVPGVSEEMRRVFRLLADGTGSIIDYRGCAQHGTAPRHYYARSLAKPALSVVESATQAG